MFRKESDFEAFERVMVEAHLQQPIVSCRIAFYPTIGILSPGRRRTVN
jgi:hypothetical protein